jgi:hypothetical protein
MTLLAVLTLILAPVCVFAAYATVCAVFLVELRRRDRELAAAQVATRPSSDISLRSRRRQPFSGPRSWRSRKSSARSATSRQPSSTASECPRSGSTTYSVAPVLRR